MQWEKHLFGKGRGGGGREEGQKGVLTLFLDWINSYLVSIIRRRIFIRRPCNQSQIIHNAVTLASFITIGLSIVFSVCHAQENLEPGVYRWSIKTSLAPGASQKNTTLDELLSLQNPVNDESDAPAKSRIPKMVNGFKEGDIITITGWLHLVALEDDPQNHNQDGDFHIQIRNSPVWGDTCLIVEIPDPDFVSDPNLKQKCMQARQFVISNLLNNQQPGTKGNKMVHPVFVSITGQLYFDAIHLKGIARGKEGMHSYTCWELHPVTDISFAPKPQMN